MAARSREPGSHPFSTEELKRWTRRYGRSAVDALSSRWDTGAVDKAVDALLTSLVDGTAFDRGFIAADLARRRSEAAMVAREVEIFDHAAKLMAQTVAMRESLAGKLASPGGAEALKAVNGTLDATANLVSALAEKNATMGGGVPGGSATPGGQPPGEEGEPETGPPPGGDDGKPPCYETYKRRIAQLWRQKEEFGDSFMWWLQWADALKDLTLCAGPAAVKLLLEMLAAAKGKGGDDD